MQARFAQKTAWRDFDFAGGPQVADHQIGRCARERDVEKFSLIFNRRPLVRDESLIAARQDDRVPLQALGLEIGRERDAVPLVTACASLACRSAPPIVSTKDSTLPRKLAASS
jgi:hypothetical protein